MHLGHMPATTPAVVKSDADAGETPAAPQLRDYVGTLGSEPIGATLMVAGKDVSGSYFRVADLKDIALAGHTNDSAVEISLGETGDDGRPHAEVFLRRENETTRRGTDSPERYTGTWTSEDRTRTLPIELSLRDTMSAAANAQRYAITGATDFAAVEQNAQAFVAAVLAGDPSAAAAHVSFPLVVTINGRRLLLHSAQDLSARWRDIMTPQFVAAVRGSPAHNMFATERGIRLGSGEVWFNAEGRAFAMDSSPVKMFAGKRFLSNRGYSPAPKKAK